MKVVSLSNLDDQNTAHGSGITKKAILNNGDIPFVTQFAQAIFKPGEEAGGHLHADMWEVFLVQKGTGLAVVNGKELPLQPGVSVTVEPGEQHDFRNTGSQDLILSYFGVAPQAEIHDAQYWVKQLELQPHPEGGWYKEMYRSDETIPKDALPDRFDGPRAFCSHIYFLLTHDSFSAFHRIRSDESWHFYAGDGLTIHVLDGNGVYSSFPLGCHPESNEAPWAVVSAESWFAAEVMTPGGYALVGCTVAPGFEFVDFEIAESDRLCDLYPEHGELIKRLTR